MTLTYRGQKYPQTKGVIADASRPALTYRGITYSK